MRFVHILHKITAAFFFHAKHCDVWVTVSDSYPECPWIVSPWRLAWGLAVFLKTYSRI